MKALTKKITLSISLIILFTISYQKTSNAMPNLGKIKEMIQEQVKNALVTMRVNPEQIQKRMKIIPLLKEAKNLLIGALNDLKKKNNEGAKAKLEKLQTMFSEIMPKTPAPQIASTEPLIKNAVDTTLHLSQNEKNYLENRNKNIIKEKFLNFLNKYSPNTKSIIDQSKDNLPKIAFCLSGGGYRAMISCQGFMQGMQNTGLLDLASYVSSLSGSTWLVAPLIAHQMLPNEYNEVLKTNVASEIVKIPLPAFMAISQKITNMFISPNKNKPQTIDLFGAVLAQKLLGDLSKNYTNIQNISFKNIRDILNNKFNYPFPIFTAVFFPEEKDKTYRPYDYEWMEINPFVTGSEFVNGFVDTETFGSVFKNGDITKKIDELSLGSFLGLFGSAYSLSVTDLITKTNLPAPIRSLFLKITSQKAATTKYRFLPALFNNFTYGMDNLPLSHKAKFALEDAGYAADFPIPPLLKKERDINIIIVCDAAKDPLQSAASYQALKESAAYAKHNNLKFPVINKPKIEAENFAIFEDENDPSIPTVIYFKNSDQLSFNTLKFSYNSADFQKLSSFMQNLIEKHTEEVKDVLIRKMILMQKPTMKTTVKTEKPKVSEQKLPEIAKKNNSKSLKAAQDFMKMLQEKRQ